MRRNACYELCVPMAAKFTDSLLNTRMNRCDNVRCSERERGRERENRKNAGIVKGTGAEALVVAGSNGLMATEGATSNGKYLKIQFIHFSCVSRCVGDVVVVFSERESRICMIRTYLQFARMNSITDGNAMSKPNRITIRTHADACTTRCVCVFVCAQIVECRREWKLNQLHSPSTAIRHVVCVCETRLWISYSDFFGRKSSDVSSTFWVNGKLFWARNPANSWKQKMRHSSAAIHYRSTLAFWLRGREMEM